MTTTKKSKPPLWLVMFDAFAKAPDEQRLVIAAELRALADWLVPEEAEPEGMRPASDSYSMQSIRRHQRQELRQLLLAEADRAEADE